MGERVKRVAARVSGDPVSAAAVRRVRRLLPGDDALTTPASHTSSAAIDDDFLRRALVDRELGTWTLSPRAINYIDAHLAISRPRLAIEFGSGVSTLCLAHLMAKARDDLSKPWVISIEQDPDHIAGTSELLERQGLAGAAVVLHAPLRPRHSFGANRSAYDLPHDAVVDALAGRDIEFLLVDGPAAEEGARVTSLDVVRPYLSRPVPVVLDDALRDGELDAVRHWTEAGWITAPEYQLQEMGLLAAIAQPPATVTASG